MPFHRAELVLYGTASSVLGGIPHASSIAGRDHASIRVPPQ